MRPRMHAVCRVGSVVSVGLVLISAKSLIAFDPSVTKYVNGQAQLPLSGSDTFTGS